MDSRGSPLDTQTEDAQAKQLMRSLAETLRIEIDKCQNDQRTISGSRSNTIEAKIDALHEPQCPYPLPHFLPTFGVPLPEPIALKRREYQVHTKMGLFPEISRAWIIVDNRIFLWNYVNGKEFAVHSDSAEVITNVALVKPCRHVFQTYIVYILVVTTHSAVTYLGLTFASIDSPNQSALEVVPLAYSVGTAAPITHITQHGPSRRVFCSGVDGHLYEIKITKGTSLFSHKMQLIDLSILFGTTPVLSAVGTALDSFTQTWSKGDEPCQDLVMDKHRGHLFLLSVDSSIRMWQFGEDDQSKKLSYCCRLAHTPNTLHGYNGGSTNHSPLIQLCITPEENNLAVLAAVASNGDRFMYQTPSKTSLLRGSDQVELTLNEVIPPPSVVANSHVSLAYYSPSSDVFITSHVARPSPNDEDGGMSHLTSDTVAITSTPMSIMPPHNNMKELLTLVHPSVNDPSVVTRVEAIGETPRVGANAPGCSETCHQVFGSPQQVLLLHRFGISVQMQLRPVDTLHMILDSAQTKDSLIERFSASHHPIDFCAMAIQIATGNLGQGELLVDPMSSSAGSPMGVMRRVSYSTPSGRNGNNYVEAESIGRALISHVKQSTQQDALAMLCNQTYCYPKVVEQHQHSNASWRHYTVTMSPMCNGFIVYVGRALSVLWNYLLFDDRTKVSLEKADMERCDMILIEVRRLLDRLKGEIWVDHMFSKNVHLTWEQSRVSVRFPSMQNDGGSGGGGTQPFTSHDAHHLQSTRLYGLSQTIDIALQCLVFLKHLQSVPPAVLEKTLSDGAFDQVNFGDLVKSQDTANSLAKSVVASLVSAEHNMTVPQHRNLTSLFTTLEQQCPYMFSAVDAVEYRTKMDLSHIAQVQGHAGKVPETRIREMISNAGQSAAHLWSSGALENLCQQLVSLKHEAEAVALYLKASAQCDAGQTSMESYAAHISGQGNVSSQFNTKLRILGNVTGVLVHLWEQDRHTFDEVVGSPAASSSTGSRRSGIIWRMEHTDQAAHFLLFDWIVNASNKHHFRNLLIGAESPHLESYLIRNDQLLGKELATYLFRKKGDTVNALQRYHQLITSPLHDIPLEERLAYRLECVSDALTCAKGSHSISQDQVSGLEKTRGNLELQKDFVQLIDTFTDSADPKLDEKVTVDGKMTTQRDIAKQHKTRLLQTCLDSQEIGELSHQYCMIGGAEILLRMLLLNNMDEEDLYCDTVDKILTHCHNVEEAAKDLLCRFGQQLHFPLIYTIQRLEAEYFETHPSGCAVVPNLLLRSQIGVDTAYYAYRDILTNCGKQQYQNQSYLQPGAPNTQGSTACAQFNRAKVSRAYLLCSMSRLIHEGVQSRTGGSGHQSLGHNFINNTVIELNDLVGNVAADMPSPSRGGGEPSSDAAALDAASKLVQSCESALNGTFC